MAETMQEWFARQFILSQLFYNLKCYDAQNNDVHFLKKL
jgi:hypothetical protein